MGGPLLTLDAQVFVEELSAKRTPVVAWECDKVGVEVAGGTAKLSAHRHSLQLLQLLFEAVGKHLDFLAQACGRRWLAVCLCQHWNVVPFGGMFVEPCNHIFKHGDKHTLGSVSHCHWHGGVVDILRGESEVDKFLVLLQSELVELLFQEIFHSLHVVICHALNVFDALCVVNAEVAVNVAKFFLRFRSHAFELWQRNLAKGDKIFHLHIHTIANKGVL